MKTDQAAAAYWDTQSFADYAEQTTEAGIRFAKQSKRAIDHGLFQRDGVWWIRWTRPSRPDALVSGGLGLIGSLELKIGE